MYYSDLSWWIYTILGIESVQTSGWCKCYVLYYPTWLLHRGIFSISRYIDQWSMFHIDVSNTKHWKTVWIIMHSSFLWTFTALFWYAKFTLPTYGYFDMQNLHVDRYWYYAVVSHNTPGTAYWHYVLSQRTYPTMHQSVDIDIVYLSSADPIMQYSVATGSRLLLYPDFMCSVFWK